MIWNRLKETEAQTVQTMAEQPPAGEQRPCAPSLVHDQQASALGPTHRAGWDTGMLSTTQAASAQQSDPYSAMLRGFERDSEQGAMPTIAANEGDTFALRTYPSAAQPTRHSQFIQPTRPTQPIQPVAVAQTVVSALPAGSSSTYRYRPNDDPRQRQLTQPVLVAQTEVAALSTGLPTRYRYRPNAVAPQHSGTPAPLLQAQNYVYAYRPINGQQPALQAGGTSSQAAADVRCVNPTGRGDALISPAAGRIRRDRWNQYLEPYRGNQPRQQTAAAPLPSSEPSSAVQLQLGMANSYNLPVQGRHVQSQLAQGQNSTSFGHHHDGQQHSQQGPQQFHSHGLPGSTVRTSQLRH